MEQMSILQNFPRYFSKEDCYAIEKPITLNEVTHTLDFFGQDKSPGPDGWTVKFYRHFLNILGKEIAMAIDEVRSHRKIRESLNSTFLTLIPK